MKDKYFGISPRIARWKLNTPLENWLGNKADHSEFWKRIYVLYYRIFDAKYYNGGLQFIKDIIHRKQEEWKDYSETYIIRDMIYALHRFGLSFQDYCIYDLINKTNQCRESFVSDKLRYYYCDILNGKEILPLMTDKYACYQKYKQFFKRDVIGCFSQEDYSAYLEFINNHNEFIYKPLDEHSGRGIAKYNTKEINVNNFFSESLEKGAFVLEELIIQGEELSSMHPQSINSFRVVTFRIKDKVDILGVTWRIGTGNAVMDNAGAGGIYASVEPNLGIVITDAINYKGQHYYIHPDTKVQIVGYKLPRWDEALSLIKSMVTHIEGTTLISWDIAYSNKGWLMVEANDNGDWSIIQSNRKIGKKEELYTYMNHYFESL